jgi:hypothetical protein
MELYVEIIRTDGTCERTQLQGDRTTVGRSPAAGISLPDVRVLELEHLMLTPRRDGCWISVSKKAQTPALHDGVPFSHGVVPWGSELEVGPVKVRVGASSVGAAKTSPFGPVFWIGLAALGGAAVWCFWTETPQALDVLQRVPAPKLFEAQPKCIGQGELAAQRAQQAETAAAAKSDRYPFDSQDGIHAVEMYRLASVCYRAAAQPARAVQTDREAKTIRRRIEEDYRTHQLRLERALEQDRVADALLETRSLIALVRHQEGPFLTWLTELERTLALRSSELALKP